MNKSALHTLLFVSHDANRAGAQLFLLNVMKHFHQQGKKVYLLLLGGGSLEKEFEEVSHVFRTFSAPKNTLFSKVFSSKNNQEKIFEQLKALPIQLVYVNTIASASVFDPLKKALNAPFVSHLHELEFSLQLYSEPQHRKAMMKHSEHIIACSVAVGENIKKNDHVPAEKLTTIHSFVDNQSILKRIQTTDSEGIKREFSIKKDAFLIASCGNAEWRKGLDIFIQVANQLKHIRQKEDFQLIWIGIKHEGDLYEKASYDIEKMGISSVVSLLEPTPKAVEIIATSDAFLLTSREDPFPLVMLEAALAQKPIMGFEKTGGCGEFVETDAGEIISYLDTHEMAKRLSIWIDSPAETHERFGKNAQNKVLSTYNFETSILKIEEVCHTLMQ